MTFTDREQATVRAVFGELLRMPYSKLNSILGSITIEEMQAIYRVLRHEPYCKKYGISVDEMTEDDYMREWEEENPPITESEWYDIHYSE